MPYIDSGFIDLDYYEGDLSPLPPMVDYIVSINRSFVLDGVDISSNVTEAEVTRSNGKAWTILSCTINNLTIDKSLIRKADKRLIVTIGTDTHSFILYDVDVDYKESSRVIGYTDGCLLEFPFAVKTNKLYSGMANTVIKTLMGTISNSVGTPDFNLNTASLVLDGSPLQAIQKLVNVSGGTMFYEQGTLNIANHFNSKDGSSRLDINNSLLVSKDHSDNFSGSPLVNKVIFNAQNTTSTVSEPLITMIIDEECGNPYFLLNPTPDSISQVTSNLGNKSLTTKTQIYETRLNDSNSFNVGGGIESIVSITHAGNIIDPSGYSFAQGTNNINLVATYTGMVKVVYLTQAIEVYDNFGVFNPDDNAYLFEMQYLNQELIESIRSCETEEDVNTNMSSCSVEMYGSMALDTPVYFDVEGSLDNIAFVSDPSAIPTTQSGYQVYGTFDTSFINGITTETGIVERNFTEQIKDVSENTSIPNAYGFFVRKGLIAKTIFVGSVSISMSSYTSNPEYDILFMTSDRFLSYSAEVTHDINVTRYLIPPVGVNNEVLKVDFYLCENITTFEYPKEDSSSGSSDDASCILPLDLTIDIVRELELTTAMVKNRKVTFDEDEYTIDGSGCIEVLIDTQGKWTIDCDTLRRGSEIYIDSLNAVDSVAEYQNTIPRPPLS